jgi:hypothetical protein
MCRGTRISGHIIESHGTGKNFFIVCLFIVIKAQLGECEGGVGEDTMKTPTKGPIRLKAI